MDYRKEFRSFVNSYYLSDGIRMTIGILLPALILGYFGHLNIGLALSVGALCTSLADLPGPIHYRRNGLLACLFFVVLSAFITDITVHYHWLFALVLPAACFFFSMIGVYGARATSIGIASLLILVLETEHRLTGTQILQNIGWLFSGGLWYILLCELLYRIRPYRLIQQALGEYVMATADYLRGKAAFYDEIPDYEEKYKALLKTQIQVQERQNAVAEMIFKTRNMVKESTHTSRVLMMVFLDVSDLFERAMTSHQDYQKLHRFFDSTGVLDEYKQLIYSMANELDEIGIALQSGKASGYNKRLDQELLQERRHLQDLHRSMIAPSNVEGFISLRHILDSMDDIAGRIRTLHQYTSYDRSLRRKKLAAPEASEFVHSQDYSAKILVDNISFRSNIFRHSLRITLAAFSAYLIGLFLPLGHSYWILLTVIVILKPAYGLTRTRNVQRLGGTLIGAALAAGFLYIIRDQLGITLLLGICMLGAYSFMRKQYFISVIMITMYVLVLFRLLDPRDFNEVISDRIIDTLAGSTLALVFAYIPTPVWEKQLINGLIARALQDSIAYYKQVAPAFTGVEINKMERQSARKDAWVSLANLTDAFNRMLTEPRSKQVAVLQIHQLVVTQHMLISHIATLAYYTDQLKDEFIMKDYQPVMDHTLLNLTQAWHCMDSNILQENENRKDNTAVWQLDQKLNALMNQRKQELEEGKLESSIRQQLSQFKSITDQFYFLYNTSEDIRKISRKIQALLQPRP